MTTSSTAATSDLRIVRKIAEGGMGRVDLVLRRQDRFQRLVALKRLQPGLANDEEFRAMFLEEARLAGLLRHPNVVAVHEVGEDEEGPFLVMDYVEGVTAGALIRRSQRNDRPIPEQIILEIVRQAAEGLHAAHRLTDPSGQPLGLIHRDVSPQNLLIGFDGIVRVSDFGVAKALDSGSKTSTGVLKGKLAYMAPEQLSFLEIDHRADLFSLGVVLYELLAGRRLYREDNPRLTARRVLHEPPPDIDQHRSDVHPAVVQLLFELLAKTADRRPDDAGVVARRLSTVLLELVSEEGALRLDDYMRGEFADVVAKVQAEVAAITETHSFDGAPRRRRRLLATGALAVAAAIGGVGLALWTDASSSASPEEAPTESSTSAAPTEVAPPPTPEPVEDAPGAEDDAAGDETAQRPPADEELRRPRMRRVRNRMTRMPNNAEDGDMSALDDSTWSWE